MYEEAILVGNDIQNTIWYYQYKGSYTLNTREVDIELISDRENFPKFRVDFQEIVQILVEDRRVM